jgi:hypothetical protein
MKGCLGNTTRFCNQQTVVRGYMLAKQTIYGTRLAANASLVLVQRCWPNQCQASKIIVEHGFTATQHFFASFIACVIERLSAGTVSHHSCASCAPAEAILSTWCCQ